jgi:16S rRNA (cytidine1402-2'-O)-methyltransferase
MLYVVATPIGNLADITLRALEILKDVDLVAAEDTRHSGILLKHYEIKKPLISYHEHNEAMRTAQLIERLAAGEKIGLITDAGTPGLSDPGARLIRECIKRELPFTIIPDRLRLRPRWWAPDFPPTHFSSADFCRSRAASANAHCAPPQLAKKLRSISNRPIVSPKRSRHAAIFCKIDNSVLRVS